MEKRFAVLIDADNVSFKYIHYILEEISKEGTVTYKRIYGDWTKQQSAGWKNVLLENAVSPVQQYGYTVGKNATDSAMIIDAMDILYSDNVDGFCLVSSDSDFTRLAIRLRESGMTVIGMGQHKTPKPFRTACNIFKYLEILTDEEEEESEHKNGEDKEEGKGNKASDVKGKKQIEMTGIDVIEEAILKIISERNDETKGVGMGELGSLLVKRYPDFDVRNYGYSKLSKFLEKFDSLEFKNKGSANSVRIKKNKIKIDDMGKIVYSIIEKSKNGVELGHLSNQLKQQDAQFSIRNYGYSKFSKFINEIPGLEIKSSGKNGQSKIVMLKQ